MNSPDQYRFLHIEGSRFEWRHKLELIPHVLDCTDMTDEEFDAYASPHAGHAPNPQPQGAG